MLLARTSILCSLHRRWPQTITRLNITARHVIGRESPPHPSRCSRRVVRAYPTPTTPAHSGTSQVWGCRTLIRERSAHTCARLEGMLQQTPRLHRELMYVCSVFSHRKPARRACRLYICYIVVVFVVAPLLLPHTDYTTTISTRPDYPDTTLSFRARMLDDGRERRVAPCMLPDAWLPIHV